MKDYLNNLDRLVIYVDNKSKAEDASSVSGNMCGYVSKLNGALLSHKIHVQCVRPQKGRYVLVEAWGSHNSWSRLFSAVLCEVLVYAWSCDCYIFIINQNKTGTSARQCCVFRHIFVQYIITCVCQKYGLCVMLLKLPWMLDSLTTPD